MRDFAASAFVGYYSHFSLTANGTKRYAGEGKQKADLETEGKIPNPYVSIINHITKPYFFFFANLFSALVSFFIRLSTILYLPFVPFGRPLIPLLPPRATTT
jgi:hypothetical protein